MGLNAIAQRGKLSIHLAGGTEAFLGRYGQNGFEGFGPDVGQRITEIIWGGNVKADISPVGSRSVAFELVNSGGVDLVFDNWLPNGEDLSSLHASPPVYVDSLRVIVLKDDQVTKIEDLDGKRLAYLMEESPRVDVPRYFTQKYPKLRIQFDKLSRYGNRNDEMSALAGPASYFTSWVKEGYVVLPQRLDTWNYSVYVRKQNTELAAAVDKAIHQMTESGELAKLAKKWGLDI